MKRHVPVIFKVTRVISEVFQKQDRPVTKSACCSSCQAASAAKDKTPGNDREKIEKGKYGLTPSAEMVENGDENDVHKDLPIGKSRITPDELQDKC